LGLVLSRVHKARVAYSTVQTHLQAASRGNNITFVLPLTSLQY
jgi:hypothetical protein